MLPDAHVAAEGCSVTHIGERTRSVSRTAMRRESGEDTAVVNRGGTP